MHGLCMDRASVLLFIVDFFFKLSLFISSWLTGYPLDITLCRERQSMERSMFCSSTINKETPRLLHIGEWGGRSQRSVVTRRVIDASMVDAGILQLFRWRQLLSGQAGLPRGVAEAIPFPAISRQLLCLDS